MVYERYHVLGKRVGLCLLAWMEPVLGQPCGRSSLPPSQEGDGNNSDLDPPSIIEITCARGGREAMASTRASTDRSGAGGRGKSGLARVLQCSPHYANHSPPRPVTGAPSSPSAEEMVAKSLYGKSSK